MSFTRIIGLLASTVLLASSVVNADIDDPDITLWNWSLLTGGKRTLTKYFDPYCEHCQDFQNRIWSRVEEKYKGDPDIKILEVNCNSRYGLQMCIERSCDNNPELQWGDRTRQHKYNLDGEFETIVKFIEENLRKPLCSMETPEVCPEEERESMYAIEKLTQEYFEELAKFGTDNPEKFAHQTMMKHGSKNPFKNDYDDHYFEVDEEDAEDIYELSWEGMPPPY
jgi:hypothetical protein